MSSTSINQQGGIENRRHPRMTVDVSVRVICATSPAPTLGRGHDVSCTGMAIYTPLELPLGSDVRVAFELPYSRTQFRPQAVVRSRNGFRYGIEFLDLSADEANEIERVTGILHMMQKK